MAKKDFTTPLTLNGDYPNLDDRYTNNGDPYTSVSAAQTALASKLNAYYIGLTVLVKESGWTEAKEYWVQPKGTTPETYGLLKKGAGVTDYAELENKPTISDGGQGSVQIPLTGNVKVTATAATSGQTTGVAVTAENGGITMAFTLEKGDTGQTGAPGAPGATGADGKSAFDVWKETTGRTNATEAEYIEDLQTKVAKWLPIAYEALSPAPSIGDTVTFSTAPSNPIEGAIVLMPNGSPATATMMFAVSSDGQTPATYTYTYIGDLSVDTTGLLGSSDVDGTGLNNPTSSQVAKATDVMQLAAKLEGVTAVDDKATPTTTGTTGTFIKPDNTTGSGTGWQWGEFALGNAKAVRFVALDYKTSTTPSSGWLFLDGSNNILKSAAYTHTAQATKAVELVVAVPEGATTFKTNIAGGELTGNFYCYLQSGESVKDMVDGLENEIIELDNKVNYSEDVIDFSQVATNAAVISYSENKWINTGSQGTTVYFKSCFIPIHATDVVSVKANSTANAQIAYLTSDNITIGSTPDYVNGTSLIVIASGTELRTEAPEGAAYLYVKMQQSPTQTSYTTPEKLVIYTAAGVVKETNVKNNFEETGTVKDVLGYLAGKGLKETMDMKNFVSLYNGLFYNRVIGVSSGVWESNGTANACILLDVSKEVGNVLKLTRADGYNEHFAFLGSYDPESTEVDFVDGTELMFITDNTNPNGATVTIPEGAKYLYLKFLQASTYYTVESIEIIKTKAKLLIPSYYDDTEFDTWIEEDVERYLSSVTAVGTRVKVYKVDPTERYKIILKQYGSPTGYSGSGVTFYNDARESIGTAYPAGSSLFTEMADLEVPSGCAYIRLSYEIKASGEYTNEGIGALMKPLRDDGTMPKNRNVYCVSKIKTPVIPYNYTEEQTFGRNSIWSAWSFMFPTGMSAYAKQKAMPIVSFFHGSGGFVTADYMGYKSANAKDGIVGKLREAGCIVFDVNGQGISWTSSDRSRHWGNPLSVLTAKKAYEILVNRFNGRRGMVVSGISMGGAIGKAYCMTYPQDVIAAALEAPSEMGCTCRFRGTYGSQQSAESAAAAWGYESENAMYADVNHENLLGYSPCIMPDVIGDNGVISKMTGSNYTTFNSLCGNSAIGTFKGGFPVEIKIWHGDADTNVALEYNRLFVNTVRNANGRATLRVCPGCTHGLNGYEWVLNEVVEYITDKLSL